MRVVTYKDRGKEWRWRIFARNGRIIAASGEHFDSKGNASRAAHGFIRAVLTANFKNKIKFETLG